MPSTTLIESGTKRTLPAWAAPLFTPRARCPEAKPGWQSCYRFVDLAVFAVYAAVVAFAIHHHLASDDEAQAWLLARDNSLYDLLFRRMHYEGAPGLWASILWLAVRLHLPFTAINWIGGAFACTGVWLLLFRSPFPPVIRWLLPFTFFFAYQYAVIGRPYTLFPTLVFLLCILFPLAKPKPILFGLVAGVLVNIAFHAAILAGVFCLVYLQHLLQHLRRESRQPKVSLRTPQLLAAASLFCLFCLFSVYVAFPAADTVPVGQPTKKLAQSTSVLARLVAPQQLPKGAAPLDQALDLASVQQRELAAKHGQATPQPPWVLFVALKTVVLGLDAATFPIARSNLLNVLFFVSLFFWLRQRHALHFALPWLVGLLLSSQIITLDHHTGLFAISLLAAVWLALETRPLPAPTTAFNRVDAAFLGTSLLVLLLQIGWTIHTIRYERTHPYDPGRATAEFLQTHFAGKRIAGFSYESVSTEANSPTQLFSNQPAAYWIWSGNTYPDLRRTEARLQHPDAIVQGELVEGSESPFNQWGSLWHVGARPYAPILEDWENHGYHPTHRFCGERLMRLGVSNTFCEVILEPNSTANSTP